MYNHQVVIIILLVVFTFLSLLGAVRLLAGNPSTGRALGGAACVLLALMFGAWAANYAAS